MVSLLAAVVAFGATLIYASIDAGRPLETEVVAGEQAPEGATTLPPEPPTLPPDDGPTTTQAPEILSPEELASKVAASVWAVRTLDPVGRSVQGTAFVAGAFGGQTLLLTSHALVRAATQAPAPTITVAQGGRTVEATLWTWHEDRDLALLVIGGASPGLQWAPSTPPLAPGDRLYAGTTSRGVSPGIVTAVAEGAIEHNIYTDESLQGAPLLNQKGEVVAMASQAYDPNGRATTTIFIGVPVRLACERVLRCGSGNTAATAEPETPTTTAP
jgi:S1-C subfamily serine protease